MLPNRRLLLWLPSQMHQSRCSLKRREVRVRLPYQAEFFVHLLMLFLHKLSLELNNFHRRHKVLILHRCVLVECPILITIVKI